MCLIPAIWWPAANPIPYAYRDFDPPLQTDAEGRQKGRHDPRGAGRGAGQDLHRTQAGAADWHDDLLP